MPSVKGLRARIKDYIRPRLSALVLNPDNILAVPFISAKIIPERSGEFTIIPRYACDGQNTAVPPESLWEGYCLGSGPEAYLAEGRRTMTRMLHALRAAGADPDSMRRVLDLGCASARVLRHFPITRDDQELWGIEIKAKHINWCQQHFSHPFRFFLGTTYPHLPFEDNNFDLAYCHSVFTHMSDLADAWLLELLRIARPGGYLFITVHDRNSIDYLLQCDRADLRFMCDLLKRADRETCVLSNDFASFAVGTEPRTQVFYDLDYLVGKWSAFAKVVSVTQNAEDYQTGIVLRKP
jgi:SAM-dependent methyltransferase